MLKFMVVAAPRSGSTWASNWLTTERTLCLHDVVLQFEPRELDDIPCDRDLGVSCTGLAQYPAWLNEHPAPKLVLHRPFNEINNSLLSVGLTPLSSAWRGALERVQGMHVDWRDIFKPTTAAGIFTYLTGLPFDARRHELLLDMNVQPQFDRVHVKADAAKAFARRVRQAIAS